MKFTLLKRLNKTGNIHRCKIIGSFYSMEEALQLLALEKDFVPAEYELLSVQWTDQDGFLQGSDFIFLVTMWYFGLKPSEISINNFTEQYLLISKP